MQHFFGWKRPFRKANRLKFLALDVYELLEKSDLCYEMTSFIMDNEKFWTMKLKSHVTKWGFEKVAKVPPWRWFPRAFISGYKLLQLQEESWELSLEAEFKKSNHW